MEDWQTETEVVPKLGPEAFPTTGPNALARPWVRAVARIADTMIVSAPFLFIVVIVLAITDQLNSEEFPLWVRPLWAVLAVAYEAPLVAWRGQTVGKLALGIKVARIGDGRPPEWWQATMRIGIPAILISIPHPIGVVAASGIYFSSSWDPIGRGAHDKAAGTVVVASR